jgi:hypothetical protein
MNDLRGKLHVRVNEEETHILTSYSSSFTRDSDAHRRTVILLLSPNDRLRALGGEE